MIQRRIVVKGLGKQTDTKDPLYRKYTIISFHSIVWKYRTFHPRRKTKFSDKTGT